MRQGSFSQSFCELTLIVKRILDFILSKHKSIVHHTSQGIAQYPPVLIYWVVFNMLLLCWPPKTLYSLFKLLKPFNSISLFLKCNLKPMINKVLHIFHKHQCQRLRFFFISYGLPNLYSFLMGLQVYRIIWFLKHIFFSPFW